MQGTDLEPLMKAGAEKVEAVVGRVESFALAARYTAELTRQKGGDTVTAPLLPAEDLDLLEKECLRNGLTLIRPPLSGHTGGIHTALTHTDAGIAETGTLILDSSSEDLRIATMLAEIHVAVLKKDRIKPDMDAFEAELDTLLKQDQPSYTAFITGASRTADIERILAIGVHGPQELHILIQD